jgi:DNA-directed RNA polymerase specialized sigma24 family protein
VKSGSSEVLDAIAAERPYLLRVAARRLRNAEQSEDAVQSALVAAVSGVAGFRRQSSVRTWLTSILRKSSRRSSLAAALRERLQGLPKTSAEAFVMRELEGRSSREILKRLKLTPSQYWQALHRARCALRTLAL